VKPTIFGSVVVVVAIVVVVATVVVVDGLVVVVVGCNSGSGGSLNGWRARSPRGMPSNDCRSRAGAGAVAAAGTGACVEAPPRHFAASARTNTLQRMDPGATAEHGSTDPNDGDDEDVGFSAATPTPTPTVATSMATTTPTAATRGRISPNIPSPQKPPNG
jgi:hypothetical protein